MHQTPKINALLSDSVCIVGNATSLLSASLGALIDSHQTVIRLNRGFPKYASHQGKKTDLVGLSCPISKWKYRWYYRQAPIIWMTERRDIVPSWMKQSQYFSEYPLEYWAALSQHLDGHRPSTGAMMIDLMCNYIQPRKLTVVGFDFKKSPTLFEKKDKLGPHNWHLEEQFILSSISHGSQNNTHWEVC